MAASPQLLGRASAPTPLILLLALLYAAPCYCVYNIPLGFLLPAVSNDSFIPPQLALEWRSAVRVAMNVLQPKYRFRVIPYYADSGCSRSSAKEAAQLLVEKYKVVGVVGPACSEAVIGANEVFKKHDIPFISYAATAQSLSNRKNYPTFYRTVYGDNYQSKAIGDVAKILGMKQFYIFFSNDIYGNGLRGLLSAHLPNGSSIKNITVDPDPTDDYTSLFKSIGLKKSVANNRTLVIFAVLPRVAKGLFLTALKLGLVKNSSLWYMGTDGVTSLDLIGIGENLTDLAHGLQGQLGISPYFTDLRKSSHFGNFTRLWYNQTYEDFPGLLTYPYGGSLRVNRTRPYVEHLIDATFVMHEIFNYITVQFVEEVTPARINRVLVRLSKTLKFIGCTGDIAFDKSTGTRRENVGQGSSYVVVTYKHNTWKNVALWTRKGAKKFAMPSNKYSHPQNTSSTFRTYFNAPPVSYLDINFNITWAEYPPPASPHSSPPMSDKQSSGGSKNNSGRTAGFVILALVISCIAVGGLMWYYKRRKAYLEQPFVRML